MSEQLKDRFVFVIFGASGDLSRKKLIPALNRLASMGYMPEKYAVLGTSRSAMTDDAYRDVVRQSADGQAADRLVPFVFYQAGDTTKPESFTALKSRLDQLDRQLGLGGNRLFYLAVAPDLVQGIVEHLHESRLLHATKRSWVRVVFEKPFGNNLKSAQDLNAEIKHVLHENQIFRIDTILERKRFRTF